MKKIILAALLCTAVAHAQTTKIEYTEYYKHFGNPERGFFMEFSSIPSDQPNGATEYIPLAAQFAADDNYLSNIINANQMTLVRFLVRLDDYINDKHIPTEFVEAIRADFAYLRSRNLKCVLRFSYSAIGEKSPGAAYEASFNYMRNHIADFQDATRDNEDVISNMEAGFIGNYGEWYLAGNDFGIGDPGIPTIPGNPGAMNATQLGHRKVIAEDVLGMTAGRMVAFRTPFFQQLLSPTLSQDKLFPKYKGTPNVRVAAHNDAFLHGRDDQGTYIMENEDSWNTPLVEDTKSDRDYLHTKSLCTFTGGESNGSSDDDNPLDPANEYWPCSNGGNILNMGAIDQLEEYHYNYLNYEYHEDVLGAWDVGGCYMEIQRRLGYRFVLHDASLNQTTKRLVVHLFNDGFGHAHNPRPVYLVLQTMDGATNYRVKIEGPTDSEGGNGLAPGVPTEIRAWYPRVTPIQSPYSGRITLHKTLEDLQYVGYDQEGQEIVLGDVPHDTYRLFLELPDGSSTLVNNPGYSIRMANSEEYLLDGVQMNSTIPFWNPVTGLNNLFFEFTIDKAGRYASANTPKHNALLFDVTAAPNPFGTSFRLNINTSTTETVTIEVFDLLGKMLENKVVAYNQLENLEVGQELAAGIYAVIVKQGNNQQSLRVIKK